MKKIIFAMIMLAAGIYLLFSYFFVDVQINKYQDLQAAQEQHAIQRGWVPSVLPPSAYEIEETHNEDTNELFGRFKYKEEDEKKLMQQLTPLHDDNNTYGWKGYLLRPDTTTNSVKYRNKP